MNSLRADGLIRLEDAAFVLGVSKATLRRWTETGVLTCVRVGPRRDRRFYRRDLDRYLQGQKDDMAVMTGQPLLTAQ